MEKIIINYTKEGEAVSDFRVENLTRTIFKDKSIERFDTSSEVFITAVRTLLCEEVISIDDVEIQFEGEAIPMRADGRSGVWPRGFCDTYEDLLMRII